MPFEFTSPNTSSAQSYTSVVKHVVKNLESTTISKGTPVYTMITGNSSSNIPVKIASNASESTSSKTMGLMAESVTHNGSGFVITEGLLEGINTSSANTGDPVWLGVNGALIFGLANKPHAPSHLVFLGIVTRGQVVNGEIFVKVQNGFEMDELHDLVLTGLASGDAIKYNGTTWVNQHTTSGTFTSNDGKTITVTNGLITSIV